ncbi:NifB/NifX family molybdenum-iron cluster-binding protein [Desulfobacterales bacterium HSG16]|nr:NifB/NifX family molybdenum-iron cluster-binding protein [Desulfobacterales bacterium HSG16]
MKIALTIWGNRISPVFDSAQRVLVTEIKNNKVTDRNYERFNPGLPLEIADRLISLNVNVLICGAITRLSANLIKAKGIELIPFITGYADQVLDAYAKGLPIISVFSMPGCGKKCRMDAQFGAEKRHGACAKPNGGYQMPKGNRKGRQGRGGGKGNGQGGGNKGRGQRNGGQSGQGQGGRRGGQGSGDNSGSRKGQGD